jgi:endonuclease/exonuclease/phosphatase family metal-dependent hydrolase
LFFYLPDGPSICNLFGIMRLASLNVQNLRLLETGGSCQLRGAWDSDDPEDSALDMIDRRLTAELLNEIDADVVALQEVFDLATLDHFHRNYLLPTGAPPYRERICIPGNDGRGLDVALLSRRSVDATRSHAALTLADVGIDPLRAVDPDLPVFRRDCLMVTIGPLTLFVCHFKSPYPDAAAAWTTRRLEAVATRRLVERYFEKPGEGLWLILGDLNEPDVSDGSRQRAIAPLETGFAVDLIKRLPARDRWTYHDPHSGLYHCPDKILASPELAKRWPNSEPVVVRKGLGGEASRFRGPRLAGVGRHRPHASDHAAVTIEFPGL